MPPDNSKTAKQLMAEALTPGRVRIVDAPDPAKPVRFDVNVTTELGRGLVDIVNVMRALGADNNQIVCAITHAVA